MVFVWEGELLKQEGDVASELSAAKPTSPLPNNNKWHPPAKPAAPPSPKPSDSTVAAPIHDKLVDASSSIVVIDADALQPNEQKEPEPQKKGQATKATPKPSPKHDKPNPGSPSAYLTTAGVVLTQFVLLHRALLHFQPSSGALPILAPATAPSVPVSAYAGELTREEAEGLSASVLHIGCALFFLWSGWKASHEFSFLTERRTLLPLHQKDAVEIPPSKWLRKLVFKPLSTRMTIFLPAYMLTLTLVHVLCSLSSAEESSAHFIFLHIHSCAHLFLYFPYALLLWIVHCPLFYAIKSEDAGNCSWRTRLLASCTPLSLLLGNCLPGELDRTVLSCSILLIYGPILALLYMRRKLALVRSSFKLFTLLIAGVVVYGGRLFIPAMSEGTISGSSLLAFTASVIVKYIPLFVSNSALFVLGFAWSHMDSEDNAAPASTSSKGARSQATLGVMALFSFLAASSVLVSGWETDGLGFRFSHDYLAFLLAIIIKRFSCRSSESVWERLLQDSSFLVFLIHPIFADLAAVIVASIGWPVFHSSLALLVGLSTILCYGVVVLTLLFAPSKMSNLLARFNNLYR